MRVRDSEGIAGAHEKRFGRVHRAVEELGHLGNGEPVEISQRERGAVVRAECVEDLPGARALEPLVAVVDGFVFFAGEQPQAALLPSLAAPVVDQLVPGDADEPRNRQPRNCLSLDGLHGGEEGLGREVFGAGLVADPGAEVAEHLGERAVVDSEQRRPLVTRLLRFAHAPSSFGSNLFRRVAPGISAAFLRIPGNRGAAMRRNARLVATTCVVAIALGGCGSSSKPLTKVGYVRAADTICAKGQKKIIAFGNKFDNQATLAQVKQGYATDLAPVLREEIKELRALKPPTADKAKVDAMVNELSQGNDEALALVQSAKSLKQIGTLKEPAHLKHAGDVAQHYGMFKCNRSS